MNNIVWIVLTVSSSQIHGLQLRIPTKPYQKPFIYFESNLLTVVEKQQEDRKYETATSDKINRKHVLKSSVASAHIAAAEFTLRRWIISLFEALRLLCTVITILQYQ
jgi:hypothetical protein